MARNATRSNPCPICGKPDWCLQTEGQNGPLWECHRLITDPVVSGTDGRTYIYCGMSKGGQTSRYEEQSQHEAWLKKNGRRGNFKKIFTPQREMEKKYTEEENRIASAEHLDLVYRKLLSLLYLSESDRTYLKSEKWSEQMMETSLVKTLPAADYMRRFIKPKPIGPTRSQMCRRLVQELGEDALKGVPGFYLARSKNGEEWWDISGKGGILFPVPDIHGRIIRLRLRPFYTEEDLEWYEQKGLKAPKYVNLTSYKEEKDEEHMVLRNKLKFGTRASSKCGVYCSDGDNFSVVAITEGEKKGIVTNSIMHVPVITLPGVTSYRKILDKEEGDGEQSIVEFLRNKGCRCFLMLYDADKVENQHVLESEKQTLNMLREMKFQLSVGEWNVNLAKGIDDLLVQGLWPTVYLI